MKKLRYAAAALIAALGFMSQPAHAADTTPTRVYVYLANAHHNPNTVTTTCGENNKPLVHTAVYNDHPGATGPETVKIYREVGGLGNYQNWPAVAGPYTIPIGGHQDVTLAYGPNYNAVAIPAENDPNGNPYTFPKYPIDFFTMASTGTADNSQLFAPGTIGQDNYEYPAAPKDCTPPLPPPPNPCGAKPPVNSAAATVTPSCPPCPTPSTTPPVIVKAPVASNSTATSKNDEPDCDKDDKCSPCPTPSTVPPTSASSSPSGTPTTVATGTPTPTDPATTLNTQPKPSSSATPSGPTLAHTGASVAIPATAALLLILAGAGVFLYARTARRH